MTLTEKKQKNKERDEVTETYFNQYSWHESTFVVTNSYREKYKRNIVINTKPWHGIMFASLSCSYGKKSTLFTLYK